MRCLFFDGFQECFGVYLFAGCLICLECSSFASLAGVVGVPLVELGLALGVSRCAMGVWSSGVGSRRGSRSRGGITRWVSGTLGFAQTRGNAMGKPMGYPIPKRVCWGG